MSVPTEVWDEIARTVQNARSIAFDGCHKIYILMDQDATDTQEGYGYRENVKGGSYLYFSTEKTPDEMLETLREWWEDSCGLRFMYAITDDDYESLIAQGQYEDEDDFEDD